MLTKEKIDEILMEHRTEFGQAEDWAEFIAKDMEGYESFTSDLLRMCETKEQVIIFIQMTEALIQFELLSAVLNNEDVTNERVQDSIVENIKEMLNDL